MLNKIKKITVGVSAIIALLISATSTNAEHINNVDLACKEFTQYYAPGLPFPDADDTFPGITQDCPAGHHFTFPGAHQEEVDLDNHRPAIRTSNQSWSLHMHQYFNNSQEELGVSIVENGVPTTRNLYYQSAIDTFELHLEDDFMANIDLDSIQCSGLPDGNNCEGEGDFGVNENGLPFGFEVSFNRASGIITWHFAGNARGWAKPLVKGENPTLDELTDSAFDTTDSINRLFELGINFNSENIDAEAWSATTTSRVLVKDFVATMPAGEIPEFSDWQAVPHSSNQTGEFNNYYWFPIGTATTIWEKTPPIQEPVCNNLRVDHPEIIYNNTVSRLRTDALDTNGDQFDSNIYYWVEPGDGQFYTTRPEDLPANPSLTVYEIPLLFNLANPDSNFPLGSSAINLSTDLLIGDYTLPGSNLDFNYGFNSVLNSDSLTAFSHFGSGFGMDATTIDTMISPENLLPADLGGILAFNNNIEVVPGTPVYFYARQAGENIIHVEAVDELATACRRDFDVEPYEICEELLVNYQDPIFEQRVSSFVAKSLDTNNDDFTGKITYSVDDGYGAFYLIPPASRPLNDAATIEEFDATEPIAIPEAGFCGTDNTQLSERSYIKTPISGTNILKLNSNDIINLSTGYATGNFSRLQPLNTTDLIKTGLPTSYNSGLASALLAFQLIELEIDLSNTEINVLEGVFAPGQTRGYQALTVNPGTRVYFWANQPGEATVHISTECTTEDGCERNFDIDPLPQICSELNLTSTPAPPLQTGQTATLNVTPVDQNGEPLPADTQIIWTTNTGGTFTQNGNNSENGTLTLNLDQTPINFSGAAQEGTITVGISPDDPVYSSVCTETIDVGETLSCTNLNSSLTLLGSATQETNLNRNELYQTSANADYSREFDNTISYRIDSDYGAFINVADQSPVSPAVIFLRALQSIDQITPLNLIDAFGIANLGNEVTADEDMNLLLTTYSTTLDSNDEALSIQATGFYNTECQRFIPFTVTGGQCETLQITPLEGQFDPAAQFTVLNITGDFNQHPGAISVTASSGVLSKFGEENYFPTLTYSQEEVANSNNSITVLYRGEINLSGNPVNITVSAIGNTTCTDTLTGGEEGEVSCIDLDIIEPDRPWEIEDNDDSQLFQIDATTDPAGKAGDLYYTWEIENDGHFASNDSDKIEGQRGTVNVTVEDFSEDTLVEVWAANSATGPRISACYDFITAHGEEDRQPEIEKFVFPENDIDERDDIINIGESDNTRYVTYLIVFNPGDTKSVEITEEKLQNSRINGSISGKLDFDSMRINVLEEDENNGDTILKTGGYHDDNDDDNYNDHGNNEDLEEYEDDFRCEDDSTNLCIEGDFDDVVADFKNGREIKFRNINKLGPDGKIIIKYQMDNQSVIDEDRCEQLTTADGCGEEFRNEVSFTAYSEDDFEGEDFEDSDSARVIVICPFILTRSGGDVFFHDIVDTGIDVAQCSEVKGHEGPGVTPTPEPTPETPSTGAGPGDVPEALRLTLPSHDVCRYSNISSNIEGYNDVLKHFSSTICELRADVAEIWTEKNINEKVAANITRISRFGQTLPVGIINNILSLNAASNKQSGVFTRIDNSLTIGSLDGTYIIEESDKIPAAQTYIVKNADLYINSNIEYSETDDFTNPNTIPSAAFIVIDGNIIIDNDVTKIDGIIMAVDLDGNGDGQIKTNPDAKTTKKLTINGNLIGNVYNLFKNRIGVGDPTKDEASVTIRYDERILLNTPPGINELIDIEQAIVPN